MNVALAREPTCPIPPARSYDMHASSRHIPGAALHDYPPIDKPDRLPLRERWQAVGDARLLTGTDRGGGA